MVRFYWRVYGCLFLWVFGPALPVDAQQSWLFSPYHIWVWVAVDCPPRMQRPLMDEVARVITQRSHVLAEAAWQCRVELAPGALAAEMQRGLDSIAPSRLRQFVETHHQGESEPLPDKVMLLSVRPLHSEPEVLVREWDVRTEVFGPIIRRHCAQWDALAWNGADAVLAAFSPVARIDDVTGSKAVVRFRAAGLTSLQTNPVTIVPGRVLTPIIRHLDRFGKPRPDGIRPVEWTLLVVRDARPLRTECDVLTANRGYLAGRASSRLERLAVAVHPTFAYTELELRSRDNQERPLVGYEIYSKEADGQTQLLGHTDWRGRLRVDPRDGQVRLLYVRSGGQLLARLPLLPGQTDVAVARLTDDLKRLQAEAWVRSLHATIVDLIAQRELLAARARLAISQRKWDEAQKLVDALRNLPSVTDIRQRIDRGRQETATENTRIQALIDKMFLEVQNFVIQKMDQNLVDKLSTELQRARRASGS